MSHTPILAVHCGASRIACGRFSGGPGRLVMDWFATTSVGSGDSTEADWLAAVDAGFRELVRGEKPGGGCVVGLPGHLTFNHAFRVPAVTAWQRRKIVAFEQRQGMSEAVEEMVWSRALVSGDENGREMMLAVAKRRLIEELGARIRAAGWYPEAALPAWLALRHAIGCRPAPAVGGWTYVHTNLHNQGAQFVFLDGHVARFNNKAYWNFKKKEGITNNPELVWIP